MDNNTLNISLVGKGKISEAIQKSILERGHKIMSTIGRTDTFTVKNADVVIEATTPLSFIQNISKLAQQKKDVVIVTTGWFDEMEKVKQILLDAGVRAIWSANYSIGVNLYFSILEKATQLFNTTEEYDIWATELHHKNKIDSLSGTAKIIAQLLLKNIDRKTAVVEETLHRKIKDHEIHFSSTRGGLANFTHTVSFDSKSDIIEIKHSARDRDGYALGVVKAAEWLVRQKPGFYCMNDFLNI